jgi:hypothetical protein
MVSYFVNYIFHRRMLPRVDGSSLSLGRSPYFQVLASNLHVVAMKRPLNPTFHSYSNFLLLLILNSNVINHGIFTSRL